MDPIAGRPILDDVLFGKGLFGHERRFGDGDLDRTYFLLSNHHLVLVLVVAASECVLLICVCLFFFSLFCLCTPVSTHLHISPASRPSSVYRRLSTGFHFFFLRRNTLYLVCCLFTVKCLYSFCSFLTSVDFIVR